MLDYLKIFPDIEIMLKRYDDAQRGRLFMAMMAYAYRGEEPEFEAGAPEWFIWDTLKLKIDQCADNLESKRANGRKGGSNPKQTEADASESKQKEAKTSKGKQTEAEASESKRNQHIKEKEKEQEQEYEQEKEECVEGAKPPKPPAAARRFTPPTVDEVAAYCRERGNGVDAQRFVDFYASKGWKVGTTPMKDWHAAVRNWEGRDNRTPAAGAGGTAGDHQQVLTRNPFALQSLKLREGEAT